MPRYFIDPTESELAVIERARNLRVRLFAERIEQKHIASIIGMPASYLSIILNGRAVFSTTNDTLDRVEEEIDKIIAEREEQRSQAA